MADLASVGGRVQLIERQVLPEEVGRALSDLATGGRGLRLYRDGVGIGFWEAAAATMQEGDLVVEIRATDELG
jgi:voltage-gated potassium channel